MSRTSRSILTTRRYWPLPPPSSSEQDRSNAQANFPLTMRSTWSSGTTAMRSMKNHPLRYRMASSCLFVSSRKSSSTIAVRKLTKMSAMKYRSMRMSSAYQNPSLVSENPMRMGSEKLM